MRLFEAIQEDLIAWLSRMEPPQREILLASGFLVVVFALGTGGYMLLEGWTWLDAFYMTFITVTTIGFTEVQTLSDAGRVFTIGVAVIGIGSVAFIATRSAQLLLTSQRLRARYLTRKLQRMQDHYVICGYGRIGRRIVQDLDDAGKPYVIIDRSRHELEPLLDTGVLYVEGDAEDEETLLESGLERASVLILTLPEDSANVFVTLMAREINPDLFILSRTNDLKNRRKLLHAGADKVISPNEIGADRMAQVILRPNVDRFMEQVLRTGALGLSVDEVQVEDGAAIAGKTLAQSNFRQQFDAIVIAILDAERDDMKYNPSAQTILKPGDVLIVLGSQDMIERLRREGCTVA